MGFDDPRNQGLLALAAGLMAPSRGGSFGGAALQGLQGYQQAYGNASQIQGQQEQLKLMRDKYAFQMEGAERERKKQSELDKFAGMYADTFLTKQKPQQPVANVDALMSQNQIEQAFDTRQAKNRADMGLPSGGYGAMPVRSPDVPMGTLNTPPVDDVAQRRQEALLGMAKLSNDPMTALQALVTPKREKLVFQDGNAMDPYTGEVRSKYDPRPPTFNPMTNLIRPDGTINQALYDAQKGLRAAGRPSVEVKNQFPGKESEFAKLDEKNRAEALDEMRKRSIAAPVTITQYKEVGRALKDIDGGVFEKGKTGVARFAKSFGLDIDPNLPAKEYAESTALQLAMKMKPVGSGTMTNADMEQFIAMAPGLSQTAKGRQMIIDAAVKAAERDKRIFQMSIEHRKKNNGILDDTFFEKVSNYVNENPIIPQGFQVPEPEAPTSAGTQPNRPPTQAEIEEAVKFFKGGR